MDNNYFNFFEDIPDSSTGEVFQDILKTGNVRIERIVSSGQASPPGFWYDQEWDEWVLLLKGAAVVKFYDNKFYNLLPGKSLFIPAGRKHRVESTSLECETIWLAIHIEN